MSSAAIADHLAIPARVAGATIEQAARAIASHPLGDCVLAHASLAQELAIVAREGLGDIGALNDKFWSAEAKSLNSCSLEVQAKIYGMHPQSVRRCERRSAAAAELVERCQSVRAHAPRCTSVIEGTPR